MLKKLAKQLQDVRDSIADKGMSAVNAETAFSAALMKGQTDIVRRHLDEGRDVNAKAGAYPPLILALMFDHTDTALLLLERGADPNARNHGGDTALHTAAVKKNAVAITALMKAGADAALRNNRREIALELALSSEDNGALTALIAGGADVDQNMSNNCAVRGYGQFVPSLKTAIEEAIARKHEKRVKRIHMQRRHIMRGPS